MREGMREQWEVWKAREAALQGEREEEQSDEKYFILCRLLRKQNHKLMFAPKNSKRVHKFTTKMCKNGLLKGLFTNKYRKLELDLNVILSFMN